MTEISQSSAKRKRFFLWMIAGITGAYVGFCIGVGGYIDSKVRSELSKHRFKEIIKSHQVKVKFFPFPIVSINLDFFKLFNNEFQAVLKVFPNWRGIFSKKWTRIVANFEMYAPERVNPLFLKFQGNFDFLKTLKILQGVKNSKAELSEVVDILEGCLNIRFKDYIGVLNFNNKKNLNNVLSFSMYKKKHLLTSAHCHFSWIQPLEGGRDSKAIFDSKLKFFFERKILSLGCEIGEFFGVREQTLSWLRFVDTEYLKKFFYPFDFEVSLNGEYDLKKIHLILQKMKTDRLQYAKDFFRKKSSIFSIFTDSFVVDCIESLAQLMFTQKIILKTSFSNQGKAKAIVHLKQDIEQKDISSLHVNFNLEWGTLLKYFEEKSPESYNKAYKFLSDALSTINKNKDLSNIDTEVILRYKHNKENLILESLLVNDLSIPQLIQRYFFNKGISNTLKNIR